MTKLYLIASLWTLSVTVASAADEPTGLMCELLGAPHLTTIAAARRKRRCLV